MIRRKEIFDYHRGRRGKIEVVPTKPLLSLRDLTMAYMPGATELCRIIADSPEAVYEYTARHNLVAAITDGSNVPTLGDVGPAAAKPLMEGRSMLFKRFADIDVFDLEINAADPMRFVEVVSALEPTFGGVSLEDIKAPNAFFIVEELLKRMEIPLVHSNGASASIVCAAALINALDIQRKDMESIRVVVCGAGVIGVHCARVLLALGVKGENLLMTDIRGVLWTGRSDHEDPYKLDFFRETPARTLSDAMEGADVLIGASIGGVVSQTMVASMAPRPIIISLASPDPEISYLAARSVREDLVMATRRRDDPNEVNNVLAFPSLFRGALDVRAKTVNMEMILAAARALAELARKDVDPTIADAYTDPPLHYGPSYLLPRPLDPRGLFYVAPAVAKAAMKSGVARLTLDLEDYTEKLQRVLGPAHQVLRIYIRKAKRELKRLVFAEGDNKQILKACQVIVDEGIAKPVLLGPIEDMKNKIRDMDLDLADRVEMIDPGHSPNLDVYANKLFELRHRKGITLPEASALMVNRDYFAMTMLVMGDVDGVITGQTKHYSRAIKPALEIVGLKEGGKCAAGLYLVIQKNTVRFFADTTVNIAPEAETVAEIAILCADTAREFGIEPNVALLSFSNFGSNRHPNAVKMSRAVEIIRGKRPDLEVDGELQADVALDPALIRRLFPFCRLKGEPNVLIFPNLDSGNIAYKLMEKIGGAEVIGPILMGLRLPVTVLQRSSPVNSIVNCTVFTAVAAQELQGLRSPGSNRLNSLIPED